MMYKGEIIAVSPKGKGHHPECVTLLIKSEDALGSYKNSQKWLVVSDQIPVHKIQRGSCIFEVDSYGVITNIKSAIENTSRIKSPNHVKAFSQLTLIQLEEELNDFCTNHAVFATQVFQLKSEGKPLYDAIVHYKHE